MRNKNVSQYPILIDGLAPAAEQYSGLLIDVWGVLHDGGSLYPGVAKCLDELRERSIPVVIISNAARRAQTVLDEIIKLGVSPDSLQAVMSSGEMFWQAVKQGSDGFQLSGLAVFYHGPDRSRSVIGGLDITLCDDISEADIILVTGCMDKVDTLDDDLPFLQAAIEKDIPMICINPDLVAIRSGVKGFSAGSVAQMYHDLGASDVRWVGKPHKAIYEAAFDLLPAQSMAHVLAVGDALRTDITGAQNVAIDSLFITGGIHHDELDISSADNMQRFFQAADAQPTYYSKGLTW